MISFPIIFREFLVASRRKRTFVVRCVFAGFLAWGATQFGIGLLGFSSTPPGQRLFNNLAWIMFVLVSAGVPALACGCICDERNEGTLGLLFLTDLNSADVVLGKFCSRGFDAVLLLLSAAPFLFVPILLGGVGLGQPVGLAVSVFALIVLALGVSVFASTIARTTTQAWAFAYIGLIGCLALPALLAQLNSRPLPFGWGSLPHIFPDQLASLSPARGLPGLGSYNAEDSLWALLGCGTVAMTLLAASAWYLPRTLHADVFRPSLWRALGRRLERTAWQSARRWRLRDSMSDGPILWLEYARRSPFSLPISIATGLGAGAGLGCVFVWITSDPTTHWSVGGLFVVAKVLVAISAARSFAAARENGSLELLLTAPLTNHEIVCGKAMAILARYSFLLAMVCGVYLASVSLSTWGIGVFALAGLGLAPVYAVVDILFTVYVSLFISARSRSTAQATLLSLLVALSPFWVLGTMCGSACCAIVIEPIIASVCYNKLVANLRMYAVR